ncbi:MAG: aldo/keto reductase [Egibacteraceae bacterium]
MCRADLRIVLGLYRSRHERELLETALELGVRAIDTSYNYLGFASHRTLARVAGDLLPEFTISTKVGFFPNGEGGEHSLEPARLRQAIEDTAEQLSGPPAVVLLHNPERTLSGLSEPEGQYRLFGALETLQKASQLKLCDGWGISTWDPRPLLMVLTAGAHAVPLPDVVMTRAGLLVSVGVLDAAEELAVRLGVAEEARWGMSPFGGHADAQVWRMVDCRTFLAASQECSNLQAAFRLAYELPRVGRVAVSTNSRGHLRQLAEATRLQVDEDMLARYRELLRSRRPTRG